MNKKKQCEHQWKNVSSKRQTVYQCELCGIYTFEQPAKQHEPVACLVETEQGVMVWPIDDVNEAGTYCEENEFPVLLYTSQLSHAQTIKDQEAVIHRLQKRYAELEAKVGKPWIGLTEYDIDQIPYACSHADSRLIAYAIEAKLKEKNA